MIESERITHKQLIYLGILFLQGVIVKSNTVTRITGNDSWILALTALPFFLLQVTLMWLLSKLYPGQGIYEISSEALGKTVGRVFNSLYVLFFLNVAASNLVDLVGFVRTVVLADTEMGLIIVILMTAMIYCLHKGIEPLARMAPAIVALMFGSVAVELIIALTQGNFDFLKPVLVRPLGDYVKASSLTAVVPYGESMFMMALLPHVAGEKRPLRVFATVGAFTFILILAVHVKQTLSLGPLEGYLTVPIYESTRMVEFGMDVTRLEILSALLIIVLSFYKIQLCMFVALRGFSRITGVSQHKPFIFLMCAFVAVFAQTVYSDSYFVTMATMDLTPFMWGIFEYLLPALTLAGSLIRRLRAKIASGSGTA